MKNKKYINAIKISSICIFIYLTSYLFRNLLSVFTPKILASGAMTKTTVALLSSVYMIVYASGQLICGIIGDYLKPKYMVLIGLSISGFGLLVFTISSLEFERIIFFALLGLGLSSLRGPLVKTISENMEQRYARISCVLLSFVSFVGPFVAGLFAVFMEWNGAFYLSAVIAFAFALFGYTVLTVFEKHGLTAPITKATEKSSKNKSGIFGTFRLKSFIVYLFIGMLVEILSTSVSFWIPTYISEHLKFEPNVSGLIFSAISFARSFSPFLCLLALKLFKNKDMHLMIFAFVGGVIFFAMMLLPVSRWINIVFFLIALITTGIASSTMWSVYIPSLAKSGKVSSANGFLDCSGYIAAASTNMLFVFIMNHGGWHRMIISWVVIAALGILISVIEIIYRIRNKISMLLESF